MTTALPISTPTSAAPAAMRVAPDGCSTPGTACRGVLRGLGRDDRHVLLQYNPMAGGTLTPRPSLAQSIFTANRHAGAPGHGTSSPSTGGDEDYFSSKGPATTLRPVAPVP